MKRISSPNSDPSTQEEPGPALREQHERLQKRLLELRRVASLQLEADSPRAWDTILKQKQHLLDQIEAMDLEALFLHTRWAIIKPARGSDGAGLEDLGRRREENLALLQEVTRLEAAAEARLNGQFEELRLMLAKSRRNAQLSEAYNGRSTASPRFLDSKR